MDTPLTVTRLTNGDPQRFSSVGSYPIFYVTTRDAVLCPCCAGEAEQDEDTTLARQDANWENPDLYCDECSERIESAYNEP